MSKEEIYDSQISPLMAQIIAICKEHKIPVLASFTLDKETGLHCTTSIIDPEWEPSEKIQEASDILFANISRPPMMITTRNAKGEVTSMEAVL